MMEFLAIMCAAQEGSLGLSCAHLVIDMDLSHYQQGGQEI